MHEKIFKLTAAMVIALFAIQGNAGPCSIFMPDHGDVVVSAKKCTPGAVCYLESCDGTVRVGPGAPTVHVFYKNLQKKSDFTTVQEGKSLDLATLEIGGNVTSSIKQLGGAMFSARGKSEVGGRSALGEADSRGAPSGTIAIGADGDIVFAVDGNRAGQSYQLSSTQGGGQRFSSDAAGFVHIPVRLFQPGQNYRGGFEGGMAVPFSVASPEKLLQLHADLGAIQEADPQSIRYRKVLILLDNGFNWNAQQLLGGVDQSL